MKILMISHEYPPVGGGGAGVCEAYAQELASRGHEVMVVTTGFGPTVGEVRSQNGKLRVMRLAARRKSPDRSSFREMLDYMVKAAKYTIRLLQRENFDVCLTFFGIPSGPIARKLKKKYHLPYCIRFGGGDIPGFQDRFGCLYRLTSSALKRIWKDADALVANSKGLQELAYEFCTKYPVSVIENGVDTERFTPKKEQPVSDDHKDAETGWRLLAVGRLIRRKGLQQVIPQLKEIEKKVGEPVTLTIVGDGPYRGELEELVKRYGVQEQVIFTGHKDREELPDIYREADVFICPSVREGMPNTVLEAMASGLPIVMRENCQGAEELVRGNGILAKDDYCAGIRQLLISGKDRAEFMGQVSRKRAETEFSLDRAVSRYEELLEQMI